MHEKASVPKVSHEDSDVERLTDHGQLSFLVT